MSKSRYPIPRRLKPIGNTMRYPLRTVTHDFSIKYAMLNDNHAERKPQRIKNTTVEVKLMQISLSRDASGITSAHM
jgi:hypothetical protein